MQCSCIVPDLETSRIGLKIRCKIHIACKVWLWGGSQSDQLSPNFGVYVYMCVCITEAQEMCCVISVSELFMFVSLSFVDVHRSYLLPPPTCRNIQFHAPA